MLLHSPYLHAQFILVKRYWLQDMFFRLKEDQKMMMMTTMMKVSFQILDFFFIFFFYILG